MRVNSEIYLPHPTEVLSESEFATLQRRAALQMALCNNSQLMKLAKQINEEMVARLQREPDE